MKSTKLHWYAFIEDFNSRKIELYDIFTHAGFLKDLKDLNKKIADEKEFLTEVKRSLCYYFWAKCEYEVLIGSLFSSTEARMRKIDVYEQIIANWDVFAEYLLAHREDIKKTRIED